ncbi:protein serine/threonine phosphatase [Duganella sp. Leaf126]|uniref:SpoIIE family protein phosphatase n=1 Tax=Duganella sp. Leaf126 TaxID=1736266 RepID=UPI0006F73A82|nr:SpoIIE family protein phosphatase [Duganella sp. Leaf126]KQQ32365.1 protein serine/threonine phosphatase [Duganella sp. Leaf126]
MEFDASRQHLPRYRQSTAADLCRDSVFVAADACNADVHALFSERRDLLSLPVLDGGRPIGLISRNIFMSHMSKPFYQELYSKKSCIAFMDKDPLIVECDVSIEDLAFRAVASGEKALADGFIITNRGELAGVGFGLQLMNVVATLQAERNRQIMHSIEYASVIQRAVLKPSRDALARLGDSHLEWQPRDLVGGDFYLVEQHDDGWFVALGDCTGHGVPGAFMTLIASQVLSQSLQRVGPRDPGRLLQQVSGGIKSLLGQTAEQRAVAESDDGLDACLLWFERSTRRLHFAGARIALHLLAPGQPVQVVEGERAGLGYVDTDPGQVWPTHVVELAPDALVFVTTDGLIDQIGGGKAIAFGKRRVRELLAAQGGASARALAQTLLAALGAWQGAQPRRDDLTFFCCRP